MKVLKGLKNIPHIQELGGLIWFYIVFNDVVVMLEKIAHVWIMKKKPRMLAPEIKQPQFLIDFWVSSNHVGPQQSRQPVLSDGASRLPKIWPWVDPDVKTNSPHNVDALN